ncbi:DUF6262 family protein [Gordonia sputi]|uniref:DUF6262 family protein n=1 Tax=Gordonia sputi TaxID=36823 RepID=UPI0036B0690E
MRTVEAEARARRSITRLHNTGQPITFAAIAKDASVSTSFLYQHRELRTEIGNRRQEASSNPSRQASSPATADSLRAKLAAAITRNRQLAEHIAQLSEENQTLRSRLLEFRTPQASGRRPGEPPELEPP